jgi:hypothetical protein
MYSSGVLDLADGWRIILCSFFIYPGGGPPYLKAQLQSIIHQV